MRRALQVLPKSISNDLGQIYMKTFNYGNQFVVKCPRELENEFMILRLSLFNCAMFVYHTYGERVLKIYDDLQVNFVFPPCC